MALLVKNTDGTLEYVPRYDLDELMSSGKIVAFKRSCGAWVDPAEGPLRGSNTSLVYTGPERRGRW